MSCAPQIFHSSTNVSSSNLAQAENVAGNENKSMSKHSGKQMETYVKIVENKDVLTKISENRDSVLTKLMKIENRTVFFGTFDSVGWKCESFPSSFVKIFSKMVKTCFFTWSCVSSPC